MTDFYYASSSSHGIVTPEGKKIKSTNVKVENGRGILTMTVEDKKGKHSDTRELTEKEITNIKTHKFMPGLFSTAITNIKNAKNSTAKKSAKKRRTFKQGTRKQK
jgi:hypothetical protein